MRYIFLFIFSFLFLGVFSVQAADDICGQSSGKSLYDCRVEYSCETFKSEKPVYNTEDFEDVSDAVPEYVGQISRSPALDNAKKLYRKNMGNIYKCALIQSQRNALEFLKTQIKQESSGQLFDVLWNQINQRLQRLEITNERVWCALTDKKTINIKLNILRETTYEACRYTNYLEWVREYHKNPNNNLVDTNNVRTTIPTQEFALIQNNIENAINAEINQTFQVFPLAYQAYSEYENNFPLHFLLEVIRWDTAILRDRLYSTLMPIAQLGYKVINAMSY